MKARHGFILFSLVLVVALALLVRGYALRHPQDLPWTALDLDDPVGAFTARKIAALGDDPAQCRALLAEAGVRDEPAPAVGDGPDCGFSDGVRLSRQGRRSAYSPAPLVASCPVAVALYLLERDVAGPAARRHFDRDLVSIDHAGSYSCRRIYGRSEGRFSAHSTADAVDITGFRLAGGERIGLMSGWQGSDRERAFLAEVRDGACTLFPTVLSPDYNEAHRDHFHLEQSSRKGFAGPCR